MEVSNTTSDSQSKPEAAKLTRFREFLATRPLPIVNALLSEANYLKGYGGKPMRVSRFEETYIETYPSGGDTVNILLQKGKSKVDDAIKNKPGVEDKLEFATRQAGKIQNELARGSEGRRADLEKYESEIVTYRAQLDDLKAIIDNADIERISFHIDECR